MAVHFRDYYEVLGVSRNAGQDDIKKAFKKLARKYHPDLAADKEAAEEKFKEVNEAYEVLSDPAKRKKYDLLGENWQHGADFTPPPGTGGFGYDTGGGHYEYHFGGSTGFSDFFENLFGGRAAGDPFGYGGGGRRSRPVQGQDIESDLLVSLSEVIKGGERLIRLQASDTGKVKTVKIKIPKGVSEGQSIRCAGLGGESPTGGKAGDLLLRIRYERHPDYSFKGSDVYSDLNLAPWDCVLGCQKEIRTPHGSVRMRIPPHSQAGNQMRIKNHGLPKSGDENGDFYIKIQVAIPKSLTPKQKELWEALAKHAS
ncbi:MAG: J domain-containing protein [Verrucomicrobiales bacterium]|nr:J domain-containing protein [Verrucomicrobiales bacterium]